VRGAGGWMWCGGKSAEGAAGALRRGARARRRARKLRRCRCLLAAGIVESAATPHRRLSSRGKPAPPGRRRARVGPCAIAEPSPPPSAAPRTRPPLISVCIRCLSSAASL
jgi:hypothetical protein